MFTLTVRVSTSASESDVYIRQILTTKVDARAVRVNRALYGETLVIYLINAMQSQNTVSSCCTSKQILT